MLCENKYRAVSQGALPFGERSILTSMSSIHKRQRNAGSRPEPVFPDYTVNTDDPVVLRPSRSRWARGASLRG